MSKVPSVRVQSGPWGAVLTGTELALYQRRAGQWEFFAPAVWDASTSSIVLKADPLSDDVTEDDRSVLRFHLAQLAARIARVLYGTSEPVGRSDALATLRLPPELVTLPKVVSYGMGVDSTAVLVLLRRSGIRPDLILFADTGGERPTTYAYLAIITEYLKAVGFPPVTVVKYRPKRAEYDTLEANCLAKGMLPSIAYGGHKHGCSLKFKVEVMNRYVANWAVAREAWRSGRRVVRIIGYDDSDADTKRRVRFEEKDLQAATQRAEKASKVAPSAKRRGWMPPQHERYTYLYPLQTVHWDREKCITEIEREGLLPPPKSACFFCPSTRPHEIIELVVDFPELAWRVIELEQRAAGKLDVIDGLWGTGSKGVKTGIAKPGSMTEFITQWMVDGRAYDQLPTGLTPTGASQPGVIGREVVDLPLLGSVYRRLPVLGQPGSVALQSLRERATEAALVLRRRFERTYGPVEAMLSSGKARSAKRAARAEQKRTEKAQALREARAAKPNDARAPLRASVLAALRHRGLPQENFLAAERIANKHGASVYPEPFASPLQEAEARDGLVQELAEGCLLRHDRRPYAPLIQDARVPPGAPRTDAMRRLRAAVRAAPADVLWFYLLCRNVALFA